MKALYDFQIFSMQQFGGVSRYFYELISSESMNTEIERDLALSTTPNFYLHQNTELKEKFGYKYPTNNEILPNIKFRGKSRLNKLLNRTGQDTYFSGKMASIAKLKSGDFDIFHPTYYDPYFLDFIGNKPYVLTVHDMTHELYPEYFNPGERIRILDKRKLIERASHIIAISQNTKNDIVDLTSTPEDKITVVHLSNTLGDGTFDNSVSLPNNYIYYVGHRWIYKNFYFFTEVFKQLIKKHSDLHLVCVGGGAFSEEEKSFFDILGINNRVIHIGNTDEIIRKGYVNAKAFIYPSLYEGFGIPILEAMNLGCPVVCSNNSCFPEVAGDAANYFEPKDFRSMYESIDKVLSDDIFREELRKRGFKKVQEYSASRMVSETQNVYLKVI